MSVQLEVPLRVAVVGSGPSGFYAAGEGDGPVAHSRVTVAVRPLRRPS